jgi:hypothetical protein
MAALVAMARQYNRAATARNARRGPLLRLLKNASKDPR